MANSLNWLKIATKLFVLGVLASIIVAVFCRYGDKCSFLLCLALLGLASSTITLCMIIGVAIAGRQGGFWGGGAGTVCAIVACVIWTIAPPPGGVPGHSFFEEVRLFLIFAILPIFFLFWMVCRVLFRTHADFTDFVPIKIAARQSLYAWAFVLPALACSSMLYDVARKSYIQDCYFSGQLTAIALIFVGTFPWLMLDRRRVCGPPQLLRGAEGRGTKTLLYTMVSMEVLLIATAVIFTGSMVPVSRLLLPVHLILIVLFLVSLAVQAYSNRWHRRLTIFASVMFYLTSIWWFYGQDF